jgi:hypothetical protein
VSMFGRDSDDPADWQAYADAGVVGVVTDDTPGHLVWRAGR